MDDSVESISSSSSFEVVIEELEHVPTISLVLGRVDEESEDCSSDDGGEKEVEPSIRHERRRIHEGWDSRKCNRYHANELALDRCRRRAVPFWLELIPQADSPSRTKGILCDYEAGYARFMETFAASVREEIMQSFGSGTAVTITPAPIAPAVADRFMNNLAKLAPNGVLPRLVFHGTAAENMASIHEKGLLPPPKLYEGRSHYTDAIWTAVDARTSMGYCRSHHTMLACAVLDERTKAIQSVCEGPDLKSATSANKNKASRVEKCLGKRQHRQTRKASSGPKGKKGSTSEPVSYLGSWAVLVRDEGLICPVLDVEWSPSTASYQHRQLSNPNTIEDDHALKTLGNTPDLAYFKRNKHDIRMAWQRAREARDIERRQLRDMKHW